MFEQRRGNPGSKVIGILRPETINIIVKDCYLTVMNTRAAFIRMALSMPATGTKPHGDRTAFTANKKIFATLHGKEDSANLKLSAADQYVYSAADPAVYPVPNGWARLGYTTVEYRKISAALLKEMLRRAHAHATEKRKN